MPLLFFTGYWGIMLMASRNTSIQLQAPDALRGRVMSIYTWVSGGVFLDRRLHRRLDLRRLWACSTAFLFNGTLRPRRRRRARACGGSGAGSDGAARYRFDSPSCRAPR